ncbi:hypothetical protein BpHYR1_053483 [Brachionus plicatilis]|uniref:Uncharacterized protein n=1 Tax=Brachionus plicatilis TaxID=10195 RepID=A0A3M7R3B9_BRAPC|nr:hypothetical protein BpHYR1_053483 [Brachionus plicatilis]
MKKIRKLSGRHFDTFFIKIKSQIVFIKIYATKTLVVTLLAVCSFEFDSSVEILNHDDASYISVTYIYHSIERPWRNLKFNLHEKILSAKRNQIYKNYTSSLKNLGSCNKLFELIINFINAKNYCGTITRN